MSLKRIYTFEEGRLNLRRVTPTEALPHDQILAVASLSNWGLATLYVLGLGDGATASEIGFALVMDRSTVASNLRPLEQRKAVRKLPSRGARKGAVALTDYGRELLGEGLRLWETARLASTSSPNRPTNEVITDRDTLDQSQRKFA